MIILVFLLKHLTKSQLRAMYAGRKNYIDPKQHHQQKHQEHEYLKDRQQVYNTDKNKYEIVRFYRAENRRPRIIYRGASNMGLNRREAEEWTNNPKTRKEGEYFDGFAKLGSY